MAVGLPGEGSPGSWRPRQPAGRPRELALAPSVTGGPGVRESLEPARGAGTRPWRSCFPVWGHWEDPGPKPLWKEMGWVFSYHELTLNGITARASFSEPGLGMEGWEVFPETLGLGKRLHCNLCHSDLDQGRQGEWPARPLTYLEKTRFSPEIFFFF